MNCQKGAHYRKGSDLTQQRDYDARNYYFVKVGEQLTVRLVRILGI